MHSLGSRLSLRPRHLPLAIAAVSASRHALTSIILTCTAMRREATGYLGILSIFAGLILGSTLAFPLKQIGLHAP